MTILKPRAEADYYAKLGMLPDGHASAALLDRMGIKRKQP